MIRRVCAVSSPVNEPWISATSMSAVPFSVPGSAISIMVLRTVASTLPSIESTSQSVISTPFNLMLMPIESLLPGVGAGVEGALAAGAGAGAAAAVGAGDVGTVGAGTSRAGDKAA